MAHAIGIDDFVDDLCSIASSPGRQQEQFDGIRDLVESFESALLRWAEAQGVELEQIAACRQDFVRRIDEELRTEGCSDRYREALGHARALLTGAGG